MKTKRFNYFIYPRFQLKTIGFLLLAILMVSLIYLAGFFYFIKSLHELGQSIGLHENHPFFQFLKMQQSKIIFIYIVSTSAVALAFAVFSIIITHKIAGPIVKLKNYLQEKGKNTQEPLEKIEFRKGDFFRDVADEFNEFVEQRINRKD